MVKDSKEWLASRLDVCRVVDESRMQFLDKIWMIPLLPALGGALMFFFGRRLQKRTVSAVCVGAVALAFLWSCGAVWEYTHGGTKWQRSFSFEETAWRQGLT